ncbi:MAG: hypothetical protein QOD14_1418 [Solirubrobacterales bacterium]|nr:hypothetical protein [Solirubrobacterales bacterium]
MRLGRRRFALLVTLVCLGTATLGLGQARAANLVLPNWPQLLPANPFTPSGTVPLSFDVCKNGQPSCPAGVIKEMTDRWQPLDASCDHRAVFALTYLRTTQEFARTITAAPGTFSDLPWITHEDAVFAQLYFNSYDNYQAGRSVPLAWKIAFDAARNPNIEGMGDLLLGMNAHINRDLPYALAHVGLVKSDGSSRKLDHDKVNQFLDRVIDPLQVELAQRYDPIFTILDAEPSPADEVGALQGIRLLRENAWRNAEDLVSTRNNPLAHSLVEQNIEAQAAVFALNIVAVSTIPGYGYYRDSYCAAAH